MRSSRRIVAFIACGCVLGATACSNLTAPEGEDPDSLPPVADNAATPNAQPNQPRKLPNLEANKNSAMIRRILIAYQGAEGAKPDVKRSKEEARKLAVEIATKLREPKADFGAFAKKHSDAPDAARGGLLPAFKRDADMDPTIKSAAFQTPIGKYSGVLNTKQGFLILQRLR